ncbi:DUF3182 family protein [Pseudomonas sp. UL073]|uniref:DUF3182 family protein n=1 Tax=Zestomonas insulae TaxID=2809017 RepID=A0ABS2IFQ6_9GAMM|nr:DUF3182 family protein [Pseudomonas insulae]MBM7061921.1 DUF3182 family protein [Pseudomonas insulae]
MSSKNGVVLLPATPPPPTHEQASHAAMANLLAELLDTPFLGDYQDHAAPNLYVIPTDTLIGTQAHDLDIHGPDDLFGGSVAHPFMATKAITHGLPAAGAHAPDGWAYDFAGLASSAILVGFTVFNATDAGVAGQILLAAGSLRVKPVRGKAGRGQEVMRSADELQRYLDGLDAEELATWGLVLEENLERVVTYSVGQVRVAGLVLSYHGTQRLTRDNQGEEVYGGSELTLVRGGYDTLARLSLPDRTRLAVDQARVYEAAARACYPSLIASRLNYDIAQGSNAKGDFRSGVLEQSWRIGGASGAEVLALQAFAADPALQSLRASTTETYGDSQPPEGATILFRGQDEEVGFITKSARIEAYDSSKRSD